MLKWYKHVLCMHVWLYYNKTNVKISKKFQKVPTVGRTVIFFFVNITSFNFFIHIQRCLFLRIFLIFLISLILCSHNCCTRAVYQQKTRDFRLNVNNSNRFYISIRTFNFGFRIITEKLPWTKPKYRKINWIREG